MNFNYRILIALLLICTLQSKLEAQVMPASDIDLLIAQVAPSTVVSGNSPNTDGVLFRFYRKALKRVILSGGCLYHTSCSHFSQEAFQVYGPIKGAALTIDRLCRCNRLMIRYNTRHVKITNGHFHDPVYLYTPMKAKLLEVEKQ